MKKALFTFLSILLIGLSASAQDLITKKDGEDIQAKVLEVGPDEIKYKKFDNLEGPTIIIFTSDVLMIRYENGTKDIFSQQETEPVGQLQAREPARDYPPGIQPNMPYKHYKDKYDKRMYKHQFGDRHNPAIAGVCSFLLPGLGQMLSGEVGRGFGWLGGVMGSYFVYGVGVGLVASSYDNYYSDYTSLGTSFMLIGLSSAITLNILSIVDAVKVAKIKNMYEQDVRSMTAVNISLSPYVDNFNVAGHQITPIGLSVKVSF